MKHQDKSFRMRY